MKAHTQTVTVRDRVHFWRNKHNVSGAQLQPQTGIGARVSAASEYQWTFSVGAQNHGYCLNKYNGTSPLLGH